VNPNIQRFLPLLLIVFFLLFIVPTLLHHSSSSKGLTASELSTQTIGAMTMVDRTENVFRAAHKSYSRNVADLLTLDNKLGTALGNGVIVSLDVSSDGQAYYASVASGVIALFGARNHGRRILNSCLVLKSSSGVACPAGTTTSSSTKTTTTTTTTTTSG
jgi:hypothetical protein